MTVPRSPAAALAGIALTGMLAACGSGAASARYAPLTPATAASTPAPAMVDPVQAPAQLVPGTAPAAAAPAGQPASVIAPHAPQAAPTDLTGLARSFVALRNQGTQALAAIKSQASSSDLNADKQLFATAATIFANYATQLRALPVPASMRADVASLAQVVSSVQGTFVQASQVTSFDALNPLLQQLVNDRDDQLNATNVLEKDLGLPMSTPAP